MTPTEVGAGALLALVLVGLARASGAELRLYAVGLVVAAGLYVVFPVAVGRFDQVPLELAGLALYGGLAAAGMWLWPALIGIGWLGHVLWDVVAHPQPELAGVPAWYPGLCLAFDTIVGLAALAAVRRAESRPARS